MILTLVPKSNEFNGKRSESGSAAVCSPSVERSIEAIRAYIDEHNENPRPFAWTAKAEDILEKVRRARAVLDKIESE
jgi:hypothetical protein